MKRVIASCFGAGHDKLEWEELNGANQLAVERATQYINYEAMDTEDAIRRAVNEINDSYMEPEYAEEDDDFWGGSQEASKNVVRYYIEDHPELINPQPRRSVKSASNKLRRFSAPRIKLPADYAKYYDAHPMDDDYKDEIQDILDEYNLKYIGDAACKAEYADEFSDWGIEFGTIAKDEDDNVRVYIIHHNKVFDVLDQIDTEM